MGYIQPSKEVLEAYGNRQKIPYPYDGVYLDYNGEGYTTKRVVMIYDLNGNSLYKGENSGVDALGRILSNAGAFISAGTVIGSPFWGYFASKKEDTNNININASGGGTFSSTAISNSGP